eukprot:GHRR01027865.1.p1 GENE.GHRR01027865.1~~GHRR01027865.1.p1  ORF type:complete len:129 (-),score=28.84 GHRR01027865.1:854-1240(-)
MCCVLAHRPDSGCCLQQVMGCVYLPVRLHAHSPVLSRHINALQHAESCELGQLVLACLTGVVCSACRLWLICAEAINTGPLEATINNLGKEIDAKGKEGQDLQRRWIAKQTELVALQVCKLHGVEAHS